MILPIGDQPNPKDTPWVTYALIGLNVAVFVLVALPLMYQPADPGSRAVQELRRELPDRAGARMTAYDAVVYRWGYRPADPSALTLLTSMFLHGGLLHLLGNMLFLWIYGNNVEARLGRLGYLLAYLGSGVLATLAFAAVAPAGSEDLPLVGASGAISGVLGFYFLWFPRNQVRLLVLLFPFLMDVWLVSARIVLGFYLLVENLLPFVLARGSGGVAHGAHIGGFVAGLAAAAILSGIEALRGRGSGSRGRRDERRDSP